MYMSFKFSLIPAFTSLLLVACGGGGGGDSSSSTPTNSNNSSSSVSSSSVNNTSYAVVEGVYDASKTTNNVKDENYLHISSSGKVTAYNYMGDSKDLGNNCYKEASGTEINATITGKTLSYSAANSAYTVTTDKSTIDWVVVGDAVSTIRLNNSISAKKITISANGESFVVDSVKISTPSITDITAAICK
jgi:hypothetical protein